MTASKAKREGRVPFMGTWVTPRGVEIYSMLADGVGYREICQASQELWHLETQDSESGDLRNQPNEWQPRRAIQIPWCGRG